MPTTRGAAKAAAAAAADSADSSEPPIIRKRSSRRTTNLRAAAPTTLEGTHTSKLHDDFESSITETPERSKTRKRYGTKKSGPRRAVQKKASSKAQAGKSPAQKSHAGIKSTDVAQKIDGAKDAKKAEKSKSRTRKAREASMNDGGEDNTPSKNAAKIEPPVVDSIDSSETPIIKKRSSRRAAGFRASKPTRAEDAHISELHEDSSSKTVVSVERMRRGRKAMPRIEKSESKTSVSIAATEESTSCASQTRSRAQPLVKDSISRHTTDPEKLKRRTRSKRTALPDHGEMSAHSTSTKGRGALLIGASSESSEFVVDKSRVARDKKCHGKLLVTSDDTSSSASVRSAAGNSLTIESSIHNERLESEAASTRATVRSPISNSSRRKISLGKEVDSRVSLSSMRSQKNDDQSDDSDLSSIDNSREKRELINSNDYEHEEDIHDTARVNSHIDPSIQSPSLSGIPENEEAFLADFIDLNNLLIADISENDDESKKPTQRSMPDLMPGQNMNAPCALPPPFSPPRTMPAPRSLPNLIPSCTAKAPISPTDRSSPPRTLLVPNSMPALMRSRTATAPISSYSHSSHPRTVLVPKTSMPSPITSSAEKSLSASFGHSSYPCNKLAPKSMPDLMPSGTTNTFHTFPKHFYRSPTLLAPNSMSGLIPSRTPSDPSEQPVRSSPHRAKFTYKTIPDPKRNLTKNTQTVSESHFPLSRTELCLQSMTDNMKSRIDDAPIQLSSSFSLEHAQPVKRTMPGFMESGPNTKLLENSFNLSTLSSIQPAKNSHKVQFDNIAPSEFELNSECDLINDKALLVAHKSNRKMPYSDKHTTLKEKLPMRFPKSSHSQSVRSHPLHQVISSEHSESTGEVSLLIEPFNETTHSKFPDLNNITSSPDARSVPPPPEIQIPKSPADINGLRREVGSAERVVRNRRKACIMLIDAVEQGTMKAEQMQNATQRARAVKIILRSCKTPAVVAMHKVLRGHIAELDAVIERAMYALRRTRRQLREAREALTRAKRKERTVKRNLNSALYAINARPTEPVPDVSPRAADKKMPPRIGRPRKIDHPRHARQVAPSKRYPDARPKLRSSARLRARSRTQHQVPDSPSTPTIADNIPLPNQLAAQLPLSSHPGHPLEIAAQVVQQGNPISQMYPSHVIEKISALLEMHNTTGPNLQALGADDLFLHDTEPERIRYDPLQYSYGSEQSRQVEQDLPLDLDRLPMVIPDTDDPLGDLFDQVGADLAAAAGTEVHTALRSQDGQDEQVILDIPAIHDAQSAEKIRASLDTYSLPENQAPLDTQDPSGSQNCLSSQFSPNSQVSLKEQFQLNLHSSSDVQEPPESQLPINIESQFDLVDPFGFEAQIGLQEPFHKELGRLSEKSLLEFDSDVNNQYLFGADLAAKMNTNRKVAEFSNREVLSGAQNNTSALQSDKALQSTLQTKSLIRKSRLVEQSQHPMPISTSRNPAQNDIDDQQFFSDGLDVSTELLQQFSAVGGELQGLSSRLDRPRSDSDIFFEDPGENRPTELNASEILDISVFDENITFPTDKLISRIDNIFRTTSELDAGAEMLQQADFAAPGENSAEFELNDSDFD